MLRINNIKIHAEKILNDNEIELKLLRLKAAKVLKTKPEKIKSIAISKKSIDARERENIFFVYSVDIDINNCDKYIGLKNISKISHFNYTVNKKNTKENILVVGAGPAGLLAALVLSMAGINPIVVERGKDADSRINDIENFFNDGKLNTNSNVQFGEGGAGTFSDGKLTTGINDKRIRFILEQFVEAGAPEEILYSAKAHIGTDKLVKMVKGIRKKIISLGGNILFNTKLIDLVIKDGKLNAAIIENEGEISQIDTNNVILAIGHSARDTFEMLFRKGVLIQPKAFSIGVRIEHNQKILDKKRYGKFSEILPPADYKLWTHLKNERSAYTFCMCPGGYVVNASSEEGCVVTNGMSYFKRNGKNANSALLIGVTPKDYKDEHPLSGVYFQREIEKKAFIAGGGGYHAPFQMVGDFLNNRRTLEYGCIKPTIKPYAVGSDLREVFPDYIIESLKLSIVELNKRLDGFSNPYAVITAAETRSSSPIRIVRDDLFNSNIKGLIPCGEGCGYAGGIISAAVDGMKCAETLLN